MRLSRSYRLPFLARWIAFGLAVVGLAVLFLFADHFVGNCRLLGIDDDFIRRLAHFPDYGILAVLRAKALGDKYLLAWMISLM